MTDQVGSAHIVIGADASNWGREAQRQLEPQTREIGRSVSQTLGKSLQGIGDTLGRVGGKLTKGITVPVAGAAAAVGGLVAALGWGRLTAVDSARAQLEGMGYAAKDVERITGQVVNAVQGGMTTVAEGTNIAAGALAAGVAEGAELERYIRLVGDAAVGSNRPVAEMAQIFNRVEGAGKLMTQELLQIEHGMPGFSAAMAEHLGVPQDKLREMVTAGQVSSEEFLEVMDDFAGGMAEAYADSWEGMVQNTKAYIGIIGQNLLGGVFEQSKESLAEFIEFLSSEEVVAWAAETGEALGEMFSNLVDRIQGAITWFLELSPATQKFIGAVIGVVVAIGPLLLVFSKLFQITAAIITSWPMITAVFSAIFSPIGLLIGAVVALTAGLAYFFTQTETGRAAVEWMVDFFGTVKERFSEFASVVSESGLADGLRSLFNFGEGEEPALLGVLDGLGEAFSNVGTVFREEGLIAAAQEAFSGLVAWLSEGGITQILDTILEGRTRLLNTAMELFPVIVDAAVEFLPQLVEWIAGTMIPQIMEFIVGAIPRLFDAAVELFTTLVDAVMDILPILLDTITTLLPEIVSLLLTLAPELLRTGIELFTTLLDAVLEVLPDLLSTILDVLPELITTLLGMVPDLLDAGVDLFLALVDAVLDILPELLGTILGILPDLISTLLKMVPDLLRAGIDVFMALLDAVMEVLPELLSLIIGTVLPELIKTLIGLVPDLLLAGIELFLALLDALIEVVPDLVMFIITDLIPSIVTALIDAAGDLLSAGKDMLGGLLDGFEEYWPDIKQWFIDLPGMIWDAMGDVGSWLLDKGKEAIEGFREGFSEKWEDFKGAFSTMGDWFSDRGEDIKAAWAGVRDDMKDKWDDIKTDVADKFSETWDNVSTWFEEDTGWIATKFRELKDALLPVWDWIDKNIFEAFRKAWAFVRSLFSGDSDQIRNRFNDLRTQLQNTYNNIKQRVFDAFNNAITGVKNWFSNRVADLRTIWDTIKTPFRNAYTWVKNNVFDAFSNRLTWLGNRVRDARNRIGNLWDSVKEKFAAPIRWVINRVWNAGIVKAWNKVANVLPGVSKMTPANPIPARAKGGPVRPGQPYLVGEEGPELVTPSRNGWVHTAQQTAAMSKGHFGELGEGTRSLAGASTSASAQAQSTGFGGWIRGGLAKMAEGLLNPIKSLVRTAVGDGQIGNIAVGMSTKAIDGVLDWIRDNDSEPDGMGGTAPGSGAWRRPSRGPITSRYGPRWGAFHSGIDVAGGGPTFAAAAGSVLRTGWNLLTGRTGIGIVLSHGGGVFTYYGHNPPGGVAVRPGQSVDAGQRIGRQGATGNVTGVHVHFELHRGGLGRAVNPEQLGVFDSGGIFNSGMLAANLSNKPEMILTDSQWRSLSTLASSGIHSRMVSAKAMSLPQYARQSPLPGGGGPGRDLRGLEITGEFEMVGNGLVRIVRGEIKREVYASARDGKAE